MEFNILVKDCDWTAKDFDTTKCKETVAQQFATANAIDAMKASGSVERHAKGRNGKMGGKKAPLPHGPCSALALTQLGPRPRP